MGNGHSNMFENESPSRKLGTGTLEGLAKLITSGDVKNIVVMTGAGISTSAGIPDFRSPDTGLYANLARLNLPHPEAVFELSFFRNNPLPFYTLAHELYPGKFRPTITHSFIRLLHDKGLLHKHFTQNIDCLDKEAGVPAEKTFEAHGSFAKSSCIDCHSAFPDDSMWKHVNEKKVPHCLQPNCGGLVKPNIVFFGEALPSEFSQSREILLNADLCLVLGTSLSVQPFASLPEIVPLSAPRVLINKEQVGSLGSRMDDIIILEDCDDGVRKLARACGWLEELEKLWQATAPQAGSIEKSPIERTKEEAVADEIDILTKEIDKTLKISEDHDRTTREALGKSVQANDKLDSAGREGLGAKSENTDLVHVFPHFTKKPSL